MAKNDEIGTPAIIPFSSLIISSLYIICLFSSNNLNNLYNYGLYISTIVSEIKGVDKKVVNERYNSLYIHNKTDIKIIQEWLGHSSIATTGNIYGHLQFKQKISTGIVLENLLA